MWPPLPDPHIKLLQVAESLVDFPSKLALPPDESQTFYRRAISSGYYALFHFIVSACAARMAGSNRVDDMDQYLVSRTISHKQILEVSEQFCKANRQGRLPFEKNEFVHVSPEVFLLCSLFSDLQKERNKADYDLKYLASYTTAVQYLSELRDLFTVVNHAGSLEAQPSFTDLCTAIVFRDSLKYI